MRTKAYRRHHIKRLKRVRSHYYDGDISEKQLQLLIHTRKPCSCYMCGNPRRHFGEITRQEELSNLELQECSLED